MPRPTAVNTGTKKNKTIKRGNIEMASSPDVTSGYEGLNWFSSIAPGDGVVLVTDSYVQGYSNLANARPLFYKSPSTSDADLLNTINGLPDRVGQTRFTLISDALNWVATSGKYKIVNKEADSIYTDNLRLHTEIDNMTSYPKASTIWYDMGANGLHFNECNFVSSPNAVGSGVRAYTNSTDILNTDYHSIFFAIEFNSTAQYPNGHTGSWEKIFGFNAGGSDRSPGIWRWPSERKIHWRYDPSNSGCDFGKNSDYAEFDLNKVYFVGVTKNGSTATCYVNGVQVNQTSVSNPKTAGSSPINLFEYYTSNLAKISSMYIYGSVLTDEQVKQLYYRSQLVTTNLRSAFDSSNITSHKFNLANNTWADLVNNNNIQSGFSNGNPSWANNFTDITICALIEKTSASNNSYACHPIQKWNSGYNVNASFVLYFFDNHYGNNADGLIGWYGYTNNNGWTDITSGNYSYRMGVGEIAHIVLQRNSSGGQLWVNGVKIGSRGGGTGTLGPNTASYSDIGVYGPQTNAWAKVHQALFYDRELTDAEVVQNFKAVQHRIKK